MKNKQYLPLLIGMYTLSIGVEAAVVIPARPTPIIPRVSSPPRSSIQSTTTTVKPKILETPYPVPMVPTYPWWMFWTPYNSEKKESDGDE